VKCPLCGEMTSKDDIYCANCGYNLLQDEPGVEPVAEGEAERADVGVDIPLVEAVEDDDSPFALVDFADEAEPQGADKKWRTLLIAAIVLFVVLCCCCSASLVFLSMMGESSY
jgi:hypothetical protein